MLKSPALLQPLSHHSQTPSSSRAYLPSLSGSTSAAQSALQGIKLSDRTQDIDRPSRSRHICAASMPMSGGSSGSTRQGQAGAQALKIANELTKWTVSSAAAAVLLWRRDLHVAWAILGSIVNVVICKVLKHVINEQRPASARKEDPGMPSSHAQSGLLGLAYLSVYAASSILSAWGVSEPTLARTSAAAVLGLGAFMAWLRVVAGYHTWPQVIVGFSLGSTMSVVWQQWGWQHVLPQAVHQPWIAQAVVALMTLGVGAFAIKTLLGASKDAQRLRLLMQ